ncbi:aminoglycoside phosphotransferase family protein [Lentzea nigeriaca]|uniref:aminoglycoside phosphotransferase family protein n=1 Tax=Lentzea nigeriaca TaxID=1128665 RepID=UPI00195D16EC|nr:aminoglycoside phosphotransferase family protein [Lentzea nigeriaca]MBM7863351.1 hygromycin-B 7''-O-kinase [Lentzea nigeriaca]
MEPDGELLRDRLGLRGGVVRFEDGSLPVFAIGDDLVLKLWPPEHHDEVATEVAVLEAVRGRLPVPTPELHDTGMLDEWAYVLMSRLHGEEPKVPDVEVSAQVGEMLKALHEIAPPEVLGPGDWAAFVAERRAKCVEQQRKHGLGEWWLEQIPEFLDGVDLGEAEPVLLHTEVMSAHLLRQNGKLSGLFDFEPAMRGAFEYEFVGAGIFVTKGDRRCWKAMVDAYGRTPEPRRVMAYTLLHVYSNVPWFMKDLPQADTLDELAVRWFRE